MESSLALYLREIGRFPLLKPEEELELGRLIKDEHDMEAREKMINCNLRLVVSVAKSFKNGNHNIPLEDLIADGNIGLMNAVDKYDYTLGYKFSTCAVPWIKSEIMKGIANKSRAIRLPANVIQEFNKMNKAIEACVEDGILEPTDEQIGKKMGKTAEEVARLKQWKQNTASLETPLGDEDGNTIGDLCADTHSETPVEYAERGEREIFVQKLLSECDERTRAIFKLRFGLGVPGDPEEYMVEHTLEEIGDIIEPHITRERVRQIVAQQLTRWKMQLGNDFDM